MGKESKPVYVVTMAIYSENEGISYGELVGDELVGDDEVFAFYAAVEFAEDDFCCSMQ